MKSRKILSIAAAVCATAVSSVSFAADTTSAAAPLSAPQVEQVKQVVHDYLINNPQVLIEASQALQKQEIAKVEQKAKSAISGNAAQIFADNASPVVGNPKGDVTLVEFFDYQCPHCKDMSAIVEQVRAADNNLRIVMKELPIFGASSKDVAMIALAAQEQGADKYLRFHNALMATANPLSKDKALQVAKSVGLDTDKLTKDMNSDKVKKQIDDNFKLAQALGLMGTPTFIISKWEIGKDNAVFVQKAAFVPGVVDAGSMQDLIAQARKS